MRGGEEASGNEAVEDGGVGVDKVFVKMLPREKMKEIESTERIRTGAEDFECLMRLKRRCETAEIGAMAPLRVGENLVDEQRWISFDERG